MYFSIIAIAMNIEHNKEEEEEQEYLNSLNELELMAYHIAKRDLGSIFYLQVTTGFIQWKLNKDNKNTNNNETPPPLSSTTSLKTDENQQNKNKKTRLE